MVEILNMSALSLSYADKNITYKKMLALYIPANYTFHMYHFNISTF